MKNSDKIIGYKNQVEKLKVVCDILESPEKYRKFHTDLPKSLLLFGEENVGKTFMAEVLTEDCGRTFFSITETVSMPKKVKRIFRQAKKKAPSVVFIDELNCYTKSFYHALNAEMERSYGEEVFFVATFDGDEEKVDSELDGLHFDYKIEIPEAEFEDKCKIFQALLSNKMLDEKFDFNDFCCFAQDCSCEEVEDGYRMASVKAIHEGKEGVGLDHFVKAILELQGVPLAVKFEESTAYHEAGHAAVSLLLGEPPACIVLYEGGGGYYCSRTNPPETFAERERKYVIGMSGRACEYVFFPSCGIGSYGDFDKVKEGLSYDLSDYASKGFEFFNATKSTSNAYNDLLAQKAREELSGYFERAKKLIAENRPLVIALVERLKEKHYLLHSEIVQIYEEYRKSIKE